MRDEPQPPELPGYDYADDMDDEASGPRAWLRNCLFVAVSILMVCTLVSTSMLGAFLVRREIVRSNTPPTMAALAPLPTRIAPAVATIPPQPTQAAEGLSAAGGEQPAMPESSAVTGTDARIVLVSSDGQLETVSPDGSDRRVLTRRADGTFYQFPAWSPDGELIAAIGSNSLGVGIHIFDDRAGEDAAASRRVYFSRSQAPFYLYWSPDSRQISFLANHSRNLYGLNVVPSDGTAVSRLLATGSPIYWEWRQDSQSMLVHSTDDNRAAAVDWLPLEGNAQPSPLADPGFFQTPGISPSGRQLALVESEGRDSTLLLVDVDTGEQTAVETTGSIAMSWSPASDLLAYTGGALNNHPYWGPLRLLDAATGRNRLLTSETVLAFFWSPDGNRLAYLTLNQREPGDGVNARLPEPERSSRLGKATTPIQSGGNGLLKLSVIDIDTGRGLRLLDFQPSPLFVSQFLPFYPQYALSHQIWSPDSESIVLPIRDDGDDLIVVVPVNGGAARPIAEGDIAFWGPR